MGQWVWNTRQPLRITVQIGTQKLTHCVWVPVLFLEVITLRCEVEYALASESRDRSTVRMRSDRPSCSIKTFEALDRWKSRSSPSRQGLMRVSSFISRLRDSLGQVAATCHNLPTSWCVLHLRVPWCRDLVLALACQSSLLSNSQRTASALLVGIAVTSANSAASRQQWSLCARMMCPSTCPNMPQSY